MRERIRAADIAIVLVVVSFILRAAAAKLLDHSTRVYDTEGNPLYTTTGNNSGRVGGGLIVLAVLVAVGGAAFAARRRPRVQALFVGQLVFVVWWIAASAYQGAVHGKDLQNLVAVGVVLASVAYSRPSRRVVELLAGVAVLTAIATLVFAQVQPDVASLPCRVDKCGVYGTLLTGFFPQENVLVLLMTLLLPTLAVIRQRWLLIVSWVLVAAVILGTGGRAGELSLAVSVVVLFVWRRDWTRFSRSIIARFIPPFALVVSLVTFLVANGRDLTGRGVLYEAIRHSLHGTALILGPGPNTLANAHSSNLTGNFLAVKEHGQAPYLLVHTGVVGLLIFSALLLIVAFQRRWTVTQSLGLVGLVIAATEFATESTLELDSRSYSLFALALFFNLVAGDADGDEDPTATTSKKQQRSGAPREQLTKLDGRGRIPFRNGAQVSRRAAK